jgi:tRNA(Ile)-lysidine synthase
MPEWRALPGSQTHLFRPLLSVPRAALAQYAIDRGLRWIEDESNDSTRHDRNFLRHDIAPRLEARFPGWRDALARFARHAGAAEELLGELARIDGLPARAGEPLPLTEALTAARRANLLRAYLALNGLPMPAEARLAEMADQLFDARGDARVRLEHAGASLVRHRSHARIETLGPDAGPWRVDWSGEAELDLGAGRGRVRFEPEVGAGIDAQRVREAGWHFAARAGGERIRLERARPTRTLKNLLQEHDVPGWRRERLPLLFHGERLVWVPNVGIAAEYRCPSDAAGLVPAWMP